MTDQQPRDLFPEVSGSGARLFLTRTPAFVDSAGRAHFVTSQNKGLFEQTDYQEVEAALNQGYTARVARDIAGVIGDHLSKLHEGEPLRVLELGGGTGDWFDRFNDLTRYWVNVEPGDYELLPSQARRLSDPRYAEIRCSAEEIPLPDGAFDCVLAVASLDHVPDYKKAVSEARRLLRSGGIFVVQLNSASSWWKIVLARTQLFKARRRRAEAEHFIVWSFEEAYQRLETFFGEVEARSITFIPFIPHVWRGLLAISNWIGDRVAPKKGANLILCCVKLASNPKDSDLIGKTTDTQVLP